MADQQQSKHNYAIFCIPFLFTTLLNTCAQSVDAQSPEEDVTVRSPEDMSIIVAAGIIGVYLVAFLAILLVVFKVRRYVRRRQKQKHRYDSNNSQLQPQPG